MKNAILDVCFLVVRFIAIFISFVLVNAIIFQAVKEILYAWTNM